VKRIPTRTWVPVLCASVGVMLLSPVWAGEPAAAPKFYVYCMEMGVPGLKPRPPAEQAKLLRELGFDGGAYAFWLDEQLEENLRLFDQSGLRVYMLYTGINLKPGAQAYDARLPEAIRRLKGREVTVCVTLTGLKPADPQGMEPAVKALRELGDAAAQAGVRISIYHHVNNWTESLPFVFEVVRKANHPQVGANFNLCHFLKVDGDKDYRPLLKENAGKIFGVTICGAQRGANAWTNGLIQPLDRGDFDNRQLLALLHEIGYRGPIGLMCYGIPGDPREHLARSMKVWKSWWAKAAGQKSAAKKPKEDQPISEETFKKVEAALPDKAPAQPAQPRKILVFTLTKGFRHKSIPLAAKTLELMGKKTGAFETVTSDNLDMLRPEKKSKQ